MASNFLEQLVAEWYEYRGYFVRRNVWVGKLAKGGYECELDVVALHPENAHLVHVEPSMDCNKWETREKRFAKKFRAGRKYIPGLFKGFLLPAEIEQKALFVYGSNVKHKRVGGGHVQTIRELIGEIAEALNDKKVAKNAVPEHLPVLRTFQFVSEYRAELLRVWGVEGA